MNRSKFCIVFALVLCIVRDGGSKFFFDLFEVDRFVGVRHTGVSEHIRARAREWSIDRCFGNDYDKIHRLQSPSGSRKAPRRQTRDDWRRSFSETRKSCSKNSRRKEKSSKRRRRSTENRRGSTKTTKEKSKTQKKGNDAKIELTSPSFFRVEIATKKRLKKLRSTAEEKELDGTTYTSRLRKQSENKRRTNVFLKN